MKEMIIHSITRLVISAVTLSVFMWGVERAIDNGISRQDEMLCYSAMTSGNSHWATKCKCYYEGGDISCIRMVKGVVDVSENN